jgi:hypothetical protein
VEDVLAKDCQEAGRLVHALEAYRASREFDEGGSARSMWFCGAECGGRVDVRSEGVIFHVGKGVGG